MGKVPETGVREAGIVSSIKGMERTWSLWATLGKSRVTGDG